jgi:hypothetical protein
MNTTILSALISILCLVIGALVWKFVFNRDFTFESVWPPPKALVIVPVVLFAIAATFILINKKGS